MDKIQSVVHMQFLVRKVSHSNGNFKPLSYTQSLELDVILFLGVSFLAIKIQIKQRNTTSVL